MSLSIDGDVIHIKGHCRVEDAEALVVCLRKNSQVRLDLTDCESLHAAVVQAILAFGVIVAGEPRDGFLRDLLTPALARNAKVAL